MEDFQVSDSNGMVIPPLLHQMWISADGRSGPSRRNLHFVKQTKQRFRSFQYRFWTSISELFEQNPEISKYRDLYNSVEPHICRCDIARYLVLYCRGGVYADLDVNFEVEMPQWMLKREILFFLEYDKVNMPFLIHQGINLVPHHVTNSLMASRPHHPFWLQLLDSIALDFETKTPQNPTEVMAFTGPRKLALELMEYLKTEDDPLTSELRPLPSYFMDRRTRHPLRLATLEHHYGSTWKMESYLGILLEFYRDAYIVVVLGSLVVVGLAVLSRSIKR